jgi:hypothetical protein
MTKISQWQRIALLAAGISASVVPMAWSQELYQTHTDGSIWEYTGVPCKGTACSGWLELDNNPDLKMIASGEGLLFELHKDGSIWWYVGPACSGGYCPGWVELNNNPLAVTIGAGPNGLYEVNTDGTLWAWNGVICNGSFCPGWTQWTEPQTDPTPLYAANSTVLVADDGAPGIFIYMGTPFSWPQIDDAGALSVAVDGIGGIYALDQDGTILTRGYYGFYAISQDKVTESIAAGGNSAGGSLYKQQKNHSIWQLTICNDDCYWQEIDDHATSGVPVAGSNTVYQIRKTPTSTSIWQYTGTPCSGTVCSGWVKLDDNPTTLSIVAGPQVF